MISNTIFESSSKLHSLKNILAPLIEEGLIIAFSGGVDSGFLLWSAMELFFTMRTRGKVAKLLALLTISPSVPEWEIEEAKNFAANLKAELIIKNSHELEQEAYIKNDRMRCYYCKSELFKIAKEEATKRQYKHIAYGYNASDRKDVRFGHFAAQENNIHAPLDKADLSKDEIRNILKEIGLSLADKPASPCLASRIMTGVQVTEKKLQDIQAMEKILRDAGLQVFRVRLHEEKKDHHVEAVQFRYFRIEVAQNEMPAVLDIRNKLVQTARKMGYSWVNLDLAGYQVGGGVLAQ